MKYINIILVFKLTITIFRMQNKLRSQGGEILISYYFAIMYKVTLIS